MPSTDSGTQPTFLNSIISSVQKFLGINSEATATNLGTANPTAWPHFGMCVGTTCMLQDGVGFSECDPNNPVDGQCSDKFSHSVCGIQVVNGVQSWMCVTDKGKAPDQCHSATDCASTYTFCYQGLCQSTHGLGNSQCQTGKDCTSKHFNTCEVDQNTHQYVCTQQQGIGVSQCNTADDCTNSYHNICTIDPKTHNYACVQTAGKGNNDCTLDKDCSNQQIGVQSN